MSEKDVMTASEAIKKLREAGVPWAAIIAALLQGLPALIALIQQLFPKQPVQP